MKRKIFGILFAAVVVVSLMMVPAASVGANPGPGLVGLWHLNEGIGSTAADSSVYANDGTLTNMDTATCWVSGKFGYALSFDGVNDYVEVADSSTLEPTNITVQAWVNSGGPGGYRYIVAKHYQSGYGSYGLYTGSSGGLLFYVSDSAFALSNDAGTGVWDSKWHHVAGTYDGSTLRLFVDGTEVGTGKAVTKTIGYDDGNLYIGSYGTGYYFTGMIDEVRIWDVALTAFPRVLKIDAIAESEAIKDLPCLGKCKGVSLLTLKYTGAAAASIEAISKGKTCFDGDVVPGDSFEIAAIDEKLGANTKMYVDGVLATEIHTSCSRPLRVGMRFGDFEVEDVDSLNEIDNAIKHIQKSLAPELWEDARHLDAKHGKKVFDEEKKAVKYLMGICKCKGIRRLTLEYSDGAGADVTVDKGIVTDNGDGIYTITPEEGKSKLAANTKIYVDGELAAKIHTSCSKPLQEDDAYGDFTVVSVVKMKGKVLFSDDFEAYAIDSDGSPKWTAVSGTWKIVDDAGNKVYSGSYPTDIGISTIDLGICSNTIIEVAFEAQQQASPSWHNAYVVFDYNAPSDFKVAGAAVGANKWGIYTYDGTGFEGHIQISDVIDTNTWYHLKVVIDGSTVTLYADGIQKCQHTFSSLGTGKIGLYVNTAQTYYDDVSVLCRCKPEVVAEVHKVIKKLVVADEALARTAIHEAETTTVMDPANQHKVNREIAKAHEELAKAEEELENKRPDKAIDHKKKAWEHAQHAIKEAMKPPKPPKP